MLLTSKTKSLRAVTDTISDGVIAGWSCVNMLPWEPGKIGMDRVGMGVVMSLML